MLKWTEPPGPIPPYLDPALEVTHDTDAPKLGTSAFVVACVAILLRLGLSIAQALGVVANAYEETGGGQHFRGFNLGGVKLDHDWVTAYQARYGRAPRWWRAPGNKAEGATLDNLRGGDPPWCFYRAYASLDEFFAAWVRAFIPKPGTLTRGRYKATGEAFWTGGDWFLALYRSGYKGEHAEWREKATEAEHVLSEKYAHAGAASLRSCEVACVHRWAQSQLQVAADGAWGELSKVACQRYQHDRGLPATGEPDTATLEAMAKESPWA